MTLGEKIREARRKRDLSQEQLAEKLSVSRSAIAKWETDKGFPDVGNLKMLARLLNVSVDHLLDDSDTSVIREPYQLSLYGHGCSKVKKDRAVRAKFPEAKIYPLFGQKDFTDLKQLSGNAPDCRSIPQNPTRNTDKSFYLVEQDGHPLFVALTDTFIEIQPLEVPVENSGFSIDGWNFIKYHYEIGN